MLYLRILPSNVKYKLRIHFPIVTLGSNYIDTFAKIAFINI